MKMENKTIQIPHGARKILNVLRAYGYEAYVVGGCVRDSLLGLEPKDWDICTSAKPEEVKAIYSPRSRVIETGLKHGTVTIVLDDGQYEVTTYRTDGTYTDHRHPDEVRFTASLQEDLSRRDFTVNAMAYNNVDGLVDPFGGREDLDHRLIRCVGYPDHRFEEDALRVLRALRFSSVYGFGIDDSTARSIHRNARSLQYVARERIREELCKLLSGKASYEVLMAYSDVVCQIIPELRPCCGFLQNNPYHCFTVYGHIAKVVSAYSGNDAVVNMALLLHDIGKPECYTEDETGGHFKGHGPVSASIAEKVLDSLRFDKRSKNDIVQLVLYHDIEFIPTEKFVKKWLNKIGQEQFERLIEVRNADIAGHHPNMQEKSYEIVRQISSILDKVLEEKQCFTIKDLKINGTDIITLGVPEGKKIGDTLHFLLDGVLSGEIPNDYDELRHAAICYNGLREKA